MHYRDADGSEVQGFVPEEGTKSTLNITAATLIKLGAGRCFTITVVVAGSGVGTINDIGTIGGAAAANQFYTTPTAVGSLKASWPFFVGLVVVPGTGQTIAVSWA